MNIIYNIVFDTMLLHASEKVCFLLFPLPLKIVIDNIKSNNQIYFSQFLVMEFSV